MKNDIERIVVEWEWVQRFYTDSICGCGHNDQIHDEVDFKETTLWKE